MMSSTSHIVLPSSCGIYIDQICLEINISLFAVDQVLIPNSKGLGPDERRNRKKDTVWQNTGVVNEAMDGSYCYRWG
jgi:hypothetical protein